jgi:phosphonate transport system ATP-binding protein
LISLPNNKEKPLGGLSLEGVTVRFGETTALEGVTIEVEPGERLAVIGASGAGKSTLFRALTRSVALDGGRVTVGGRDLYALSRKELKGVQRCVGTIYQAYNLIPQLPAGVNAALGEIGSMGSLKTLRTFLAGPGNALAKRVEAALDRIGLTGMARARTAELSGGQQQRVAVARLLVQHPDLILADEPFAAVDPVTTQRVMEALLELNDEGATLLVNLHDVRIARRFPRVVALREGRVVFDGPPERLTDERLSRIYAGDPYGTAASPTGASPESQDDVRHYREDPTRLMEGRDGVSAH